MAIIGSLSARALRYMTHMVVVSDSTHRTMTNKKYITKNIHKNVQNRRKVVSHFYITICLCLDKGCLTAWLGTEPIVVIVAKNCSLV